MIVADTGAILALITEDDRHHRTLVELFRGDPGAWVLPWATLPEIDYIVGSRLGGEVAGAFRRDLAKGLFSVEWGELADLARAHELCDAYRDLELGLVDGVVMATAERLGADAIATLDLRDFGPVELEGSPRLLPRDL